LFNLYFLLDVLMLSTEDILSGQFDGSSVRPKALQVIRCGTSNALQDLNRITRDAASTTVVEWTSKT
jgi:hypothetical protein